MEAARAGGNTPRARGFLPELVLIITAALWGGTFLVVQLAEQHTGTLFFVAARFLTAGGLTCLLFARALPGLNRAECVAGGVIGVVMFGAYTLQTWGLRSISSSQSAFITGMYVPVVPFVQWLFSKRAPRLAGWLGIGCAFCGLVLLTGWRQIVSLQLGAGEVGTLIAAALIALEIVLVGYFARPGLDSFRMTVVQLLVVGVLALCAMPLAHEAVPVFSWGWALPVLALGGLSAVIYTAMNWAQQTVSPTRATVIYAGEPVWAGLVGWLAGEALPMRALVGAGLVVLGVLVSEVRLGKKNAGDNAG
ncbi:DMT family transporter [Acetobacter suratthaniensis]|uniref:DMT family transporter n=2 Tax=Acetobacter suratthaniensis TaxID=1502841 RepID=A0ABS3LK27_9PROT|nr:DMT family transporter [Acetobacter suratthaniensis]